MSTLVRRFSLVFFFLSLLFLAAGLPALKARDLSDSAAAPGNDDIGSAIGIVGTPFTSILDVLEATTAVDDPDLDTPCGAALGQGLGSVWYTFTPTTSMTLNLNTAGSNYDTVLAIWEGSPGSLTPVVCNDDTFQEPWTLQSELLGVSLTGGVTYYIEAAGWTKGELVLNVGDEPLAVSLVDVSGGVAGSPLALVIALGLFILSLSLLSLLFIRRHKAHG